MQNWSRQSTNSQAHSTQAAITTPHWLASEAGAKVLARGGNAIEALVAAGAMLAVVYPHFCGLGGDAVWMVSDEAGNAKTFLGIGQAANDGMPQANIPLRGGKSALTTACLVDSWDTLLGYSAESWSGSNQLAPLLADAITVAENGFPISQSQTFWFDFRAAESRTWPGFRDLFQRDGIQHQPALAGTLRTIAQLGAREFYEGELSARLIHDLRDAGSCLTAADLAATRTKAADPLHLTYADLVLLSPPPPTQGVTTLSIMGVLNGLSLSKMPPDSPDYYHALIEAVKQAFLDRHRIADPAFGEDASAWLLDPERLAAKAAAINPSSALPWPQVHRPGDTALLAAVDSRGRAACVLQSIYFDWGSGVVSPQTGILWHNRGAAFSTDPASLNRYLPGKRPFYTLNPGMALKNGRPHLIYGTQGADGQPQTLSLLLSLLIDHRLDPLAALARPRFLLGRTFSDSRDNLKIEANVGDETMTGLARLGHELVHIEALNPLGGQAGIIRIGENGMIEAAHDPRSDGGAIGL